MKAQPTPKAARHTTEEQRHHDKESPANWWFEGIMVAFTGVLAISTIGLWFATYRIHKHTAASERAYVTMSHRPPGLNITEDTGRFDVTVQVTNCGRTPAHVTDILLKTLVLCSGEEPPTTPDYRWQRGGMAPHAFLVADGNFFRHQPFSISEDEMARVKSGQARLWLYGYVDYIDKFEKHHRAGYARAYVPSVDSAEYKTEDEFLNRNNLIFVAQRGYNYDRPRKKGEGNDW